MADVQAFNLRALELRERSETIAAEARRELVLTADLKLQIRALTQDFQQLAADLHKAKITLKDTDDISITFAFIEEMVAHFDARLTREHQGQDKPTLQ